jgi:hypothetical protein
VGAGDEEMNPLCLHAMQNEVPAAFLLLDSIIRLTDVDYINIMF